MPPQLFLLFLHIFLLFSVSPHGPHRFSLTFSTGSSPAGGQWCPAPQLKSVPPIARLAPGCSIHPIQYFKNVPPLGFWPPLLLNPGDGPGSPARRPPEVSSLRHTAYNFWLLPPRVYNRGVRSLKFLTPTPLLLRLNIRRHFLKFWTPTPAQTPKWII